MTEFATVPPEVEKSVCAAVDIADRMAIELMCTARGLAGNEIGIHPNRTSVSLAMAMFRLAATIYAVHELTAALREVTPEVAGAISEAGTDIGASILGCIEQALTTTI